MSTKYGPGFPGNTQTSSTYKDAEKLPAKVNEGDPCFNTPAAPLRGKNAQSAGTTEGVQSQATVNKPGRGTRGRAVGSKIGM